MPAQAGTITIVRDQLVEKQAAEIAAFLASEGGLNEEAARRAASETIAIEVDDGEIVGVASVRPASLELLGGRPFWSYQSVLTVDSDERWDALFNATFDALSGEFKYHEAPDQLGVFAVVDDPAVISRRSEAVWPDAELMLGGYLDDGSQVRLRYFLGSVIGPGFPGSPGIEESLRRRDSMRRAYTLEDRYRIVALAESSEVGPEDVLRLWALEGVVTGDEAKRRVEQVEMVALDGTAGVVGISSVYLKEHPQLRMEMWHYRTFVARAHRKSNLAAQIAFANFDRLERRYLQGEETRAPGFLFELENEPIKRYGNLAWWPSWDLRFIGENERGDHIRVHWFPGARIPVPAPPTEG